MLLLLLVLLLDIGAAVGSRMAILFVGRSYGVHYLPALPLNVLCSPPFRHDWLRAAMTLCTSL